MNEKELEVYLNKHLDYELKWLLRAATEWHVQNEIKLEIDGYNVQVYAMDSSFLHARVLFEFFTKKTSNQSPNYYGCKEYIGTDIPSHLYSGDWAGPLHAHVMHAQDRSNPQILSSFDGLDLKDLNKSPVDFAKEIVDLWRKFINLLSNQPNPLIKALEQDAQRILNEAISDAERVVNVMMIKNDEKVERSEMVKKYNVQPIGW